MRAALLCLALSGCAVIDALSASTASTADGGMPASADAGVCTTPPCRQLVAELSGAPPSRDLDLLFVIDNSNSMMEEQVALAAALFNFIQALSTVVGGLPNLHLGVVSTDVGIGYLGDMCTQTGDHGLLQNTPRGTCQAPTGRFISDVASPSGSGRDRNYSGSLSDAFACIAKLGVKGCGIEQPLESMRLALNGSNPENEGFLRAGSFLAVIILTDEDDCSASNTAVFNPDPALDNINSPLGNYNSYRCTEFGVTCDGHTLPRNAGDYTSCQSRGDSYLRHPKFYADFLRTLREPTQLFVATIDGPATPFGVKLGTQGEPLLKPSCMTATGNPAPGVRLRDFVAEFAGHSTSTSICATDLSGPIVDIGRQLSSLLAGSCLYGVLTDTRPDPGVQPDCKVTQVTGTARTDVPSCASGPQPCFELVADDLVCPYSPGNLRFQVKRPSPAPAGTSYRVECYVQQ